MEAIYVLEQGSYLRRSGNSLCVFKGKQRIDEVPAEGLKRLILVGRLNLTGAVLDFLIQRRVETVFMTPTGRFRARLGIDEHRHVALRQAQYKHLGDPDGSLDTARRIVAGKATNMYQMLLLRGRQYADEDLRTAAAGLKPLIARVEAADTIDRVRGLEGAVARGYFQVFGRLIRNPDFQFNGRNRRPPRDPVNALLSFVYTLLTNEVLSAVNATGLDPYMGALHEVSYGRPSLACDLVEEYRVFLGDRLVLGMINRRAISPDDFIYRDSSQNTFRDDEEMRARRPVEMKPGVASAFISAYETMMNRRISWGESGRRITYRNLLLQQARAFGDALLAPQKTYAPFCWRG
jgi:CRISP-associated protein Cas1